MTSEIWGEQDKPFFRRETSGCRPQEWTGFPDAGGSKEHQGQLKQRFLQNSSLFSNMAEAETHTKTYIAFIFYHWSFIFPHIKQLPYKLAKKGQDFKISGVKFQNQSAGVKQKLT